MKKTRDLLLDNQFELRSLILFVIRRLNGIISEEIGSSKLVDEIMICSRQSMHEELPGVFCWLGNRSLSLLYQFTKLDFCLSVDLQFNRDGSLSVSQAFMDHQPRPEEINSSHSSNNRNHHKIAHGLFVVILM